MRILQNSGVNKRGNPRIWLKHMAITQQRLLPQAAHWVYGALGLS